MKPNSISQQWPFIIRLEGDETTTYYIYVEEKYLTAVEDFQVLLSSLLPTTPSTSDTHHPLNIRRTQIANNSERYA